MALLEFCEKFVYLRRQPITFEGRPYLPAVYAVANRNLVLRCSRQVEKSTLLCNRIIYEALNSPGIQMVLVCPRLEQARIFSSSRLLPTVEGSPLIRRILLGEGSRRPQVMNVRFKNGSELFIRAAFHSADQVRGLSADILFIDEFQDIADGDLPVLQETLSHSRRGQTVITGTPKLIDNHLESVFRQSSACEWQVQCEGCQKSIILNEHVIRESGLGCPACNRTIDPTRGGWVARNPHSRWGEGFWINHLMVPWLSAHEILVRQAAYDPARFKNECLGLSTALGDHIITREEIEACCLARPMARSLQDVPNTSRSCLIAGIDWGGGGVSATVLVIGYIDEMKNFTVVRFDRIAAQEDPDHVLNEVANRCKLFNVQLIAADGGGNGSVYNRLLLHRVGPSTPLFAILYAASDQEPRQDGLLWKWVVNRSATIGALFSRIKKKMLLFPRTEDCGTFLDEFTCELAEYDDYSRTIRYIHPETQMDDALHATNYAQLVGLRLWRSQAQYS